MKGSKAPSSSSSSSRKDLFAIGIKIPRQEMLSEVYWTLCRVKGKGKIRKFSGNFSLIEDQTEYVRKEFKSLHRIHSPVQKKKNNIFERDFYTALQGYACTVAWSILQKVSRTFLNIWQSILHAKIGRWPKYEPNPCRGTYWLRDFMVLILYANRYFFSLFNFQ